ncbi:MAG: peptidylprolyl isomerase [Rhodospirillales bacterium]|jgi:peptidyl-prolyl cis-trans isomerase C|nr:peptidylprolyl isomerase [Rhodospirillales bacterium]MBT4041463.1 peptidylprolyl isomerase [Rhodospirillales bacterium]MBT4625146.1 peptidylprolyl isomerase [Rhodospirillales bacterium]MBT5353288.1 peptidylprolyl isomerase [Rhodospirillales bacterium]MBT5519830.1 peptidylprolyl isomerase [Rhodospirillales bacterium]
MSEIEASHILCSTDSDSLEEATAKITAIAAEIEGGAAFADMASEHSTCPSSRDGGSLGSFGRGMMVQPFDEAAFALEVGEVSGPVETQFGVHLIHRTA